MYMTPEQAARGLTLLTNIPDDNRENQGRYSWYPDVSKQIDKKLLE